MEQAAGTRKRSLIMAGGGIKVAFQAGVLQVWLDEAGLRFDHADGASGGVFNLAMYCQGMSGTEIADAWRKLPFHLGVSPNWKQYWKLLYARSLFTLDGLRRHYFTRWGLDWDRIRATEKAATFNVYNFSRHRLEVITPDRMTEDFLVACVSLPIWFPPVEIDGDTYIDSVYLSDANLEEAIRLGADELWIVWTVSERSEWHDGFIANYFQIIETSSNGLFRESLARIEANNLAIASGETGQYGRHIEVKLLKAEVPLHYIINFSSDRVRESVNRGVQVARAWCAEQGIPLREMARSEPVDLSGVSFTEEMRGRVGLDEREYSRGAATGSPLMVHVTIKIDGLDHFLASPEHAANIEGWIVCQGLGGRLPIERGTFNLFVDEGDPSVKRMLYRLHFHDRSGRPLTLSGFKAVSHEDGFDLWPDTTTLFTRILEGHVEPDDDADASVVAAGIIRIRPADFARQLTTFRADGETIGARAGALARFGAFFAGRLWDVYARRALSSAPF